MVNRRKTINNFFKQINILLKDTNKLLSVREFSFDNKTMQIKVVGNFHGNQNKLLYSLFIKENNNIINLINITTYKNDIVEYKKDINTFINNTLNIINSLIII